MHRTILAVFLTAGLVGGMSSAHAAQAKLEGVAFDVYYDDALLGLFGAPTLSGDMVFFTPTNLKAESLNGLGVATASSTVNLRIELADGYDFSALAMAERGDYRMRGALSEVDALGQVRVFDLASPLQQATDRIETVGLLDQRDGLNYDWEAGAGIDLSGDGWSGTRSVNVTVQNLLDAYTDSSDIGRKQAFIEKKFVGLSVSAVPAVPEPETYALMLAGLGMIGLVARRRSRR